MLNRQAIASMHRLIAPYIRRTPVIDIRLPGMDRPVTLKLECLQITGRARRFANMVGLEPPAAGVTAASGGNHGIAVARAAATLGVKARIFVPEISSAAKVARIRQEGAEVTVKERAMPMRLPPAKPMQQRAGRWRSTLTMPRRRCSVRGQQAESRRRRTISTRSWWRSAAAV